MGVHNKYAHSFFIMPELPEVETIVRKLRLGEVDFPRIIGEEIKSIDVLWERTFTFPSVLVAKAKLKGQSIREVSRRGKFIIIQMDQDCLLIHLRMSGDLRVVHPGISIDINHQRIILHFLSGNDLIFNDPRKFGRVWLVNNPAEVTGKLGPEPLDDSFSTELFREMLLRKNRQIKPLLMDQTFLAGMGNIYTDEALYLARLHPLRIASSLSAKESYSLHQSIQSVLREGITRNGSSIDWVYRGGDFQNHFKVYQRTGEPCQRCGGVIEKILVGQRGTHFCPTCQK